MFDDVAQPVPIASSFDLLYAAPTQKLFLKQRQCCDALVINDYAPGDETVNRNQYCSNSSQRKYYYLACDGQWIEFAENEQGSGKAQENYQNREFRANAA